MFVGRGGGKLLNSLQLEEGERQKDQETLQRHIPSDTLKQDSISYGLPQH